MNATSEHLTQSNFYQDAAAQVRSDLPLLRALQQQGLADFSRLGFPGRRDEDWRYTSVNGFLKHAFRQTSCSSKGDLDSLTTVITNKQADVPWGHKIAYVDGVLMGLDALRAGLPPGVLVMPIVEAMRDHPTKITPYLNQILHVNHGFQAQNTAMLQLGLFVYVPENICISEPILMTHWQTHAEQAMYLRHVIVAESGAQLTVIEDYQGDSAANYYTNTISEVYVGPKALLKHYKIQRESRLAYHVGHLAAKLAAQSHLDSHVLSLGGQWARSDVWIKMTEPQANCQLNGMYALNDQQHMDHHTWVYHDVADCTSAQDYKGILTGKSRGVFNGQVHVAQDAQRTIARQQNKNLLLSQHAEIDTKPQLDIAADDVQCTHGATVGQLDEDALFYFATRGIDETEATRYLIQAFVVENLKAIEHDALSAWMSVLLNQHLGSQYE
ncbi:MAG: Fe-S cluster assembly protein SufD [Legionella sp.]|nr:MAG: Fe-S cluster assembly protein SufD [Legionella sp.]